MVDLEIIDSNGMANRFESIIINRFAFGRGHASSPMQHVEIYNNEKFGSVKIKSRPKQKCCYIQAAVTSLISIYGYQVHVTMQGMFGM